MMLRVRLPGALYRLALLTCQSNNGVLNAAIVHLLEAEGLLEDAVDQILKEKLELDTARAEKDKAEAHYD